MSKKTARPAVWITGDQLTPRMSALAGLAPDECTVLMIESVAHSRRLPFHKQKLVLLWSAMRHFAEELRAAGYTVDYHACADDFESALTRHVAQFRPKRIRLMETAEYGKSNTLVEAMERAGAVAEATGNNLFLSGKAAFQKAAKGKQSRVMEAFYRGMRKETGLLMDNGEPAGGAWNYDKENRAPLHNDVPVPEAYREPPDAITAEVMRRVEKLFPKHFGRCDGFAWPVSRVGAENALADFLDNRLPSFGPYQDAMALGERTLFHSLLSPMLNLGLLDPLDVCRQAEARYRGGEAPLNSVEGFIRQILGWREFVYQVYHWRMPGYTEVNHLGADLPLPDFYWTAETEMRCVREAVQALLDDGINHHIQRLMITGNFALLAGVQPQAVNAWYWLAYVDAHEWVVAPNVLGMALYADGGVLGTKPYAASANYIHRMSDYCRHCAYTHTKRTGKNACPFNALYWDFLARNEKRLAANPRMNLAYRNLDKRRHDDLPALRKHAAGIRKRLREGDPV